jgi:hypothetical protein
MNPTFVGVVSAVIPALKMLSPCGSHGRFSRKFQKELNCLPGWNGRFLIQGGRLPQFVTALKQVSYKYSPPKNKLFFFLSFFHKRY